MIDINVDLLQWSVNVLMKKTSGSGIKNENVSNKELAEELHKSIIKTFNKRKVHSLFIDNSWGADLLISNLMNNLDFYYVL